MHRPRIRDRMLLLGLAAVWAAAVVVAQPQGSDGQARADAASFPGIEDHFKYGSIGTEERVGVPYWIWRVLPTVFADKLPPGPGDGYARIGFLYDNAAHGRPIGTSFVPGRFARVGLNCATCHVGTYRDRPDGPRRIVLGMPANQMNLQSYLRFLSACAKDPRFRYDVLMPAMQQAGAQIGLIDRLLYRLFVIGRVRDGILDGERQNAWFDARPPQGPGRVDTFNPYKVMLGMLDGQRHIRGDGGSAVALEPAPAPRPLAALGRQQRHGGRAEQERRHRRRRDARLARSRVHVAH